MEAAGIGIALFVIVWLTAVVLGLLATAFWVWMLVDCLTREPSQGNDRLIWTLVIVLASWIGAAIYYFARRPQRRELYGE